MDRPGDDGFREKIIKEIMEFFFLILKATLWKKKQTYSALIQSEGLGLIAESFKKAAF